VGRSLTALKFFLFGFLFAIPPAGALTLSQIQTEARILALDTGSTRQRFSDSQITSFANDGQRIAVLTVKPLYKSFNFELVIGSTYYSLPTDFLQMHRLTYKNEMLTETTPEALDRSTKWEEVSARPTNYFIHFASRTKVGVYPYPNSSTSTGTVKVEYFAQATDLAGSSDEPFNGVTELKGFHYGLAYFAAARMAMIDGRQDLAVMYMGEYRAFLDRMDKESKNRPSYRPGAIGRGG